MILIARIYTVSLHILLLGLLAACTSQPALRGNTVTLSVIGTNDVHGVIVGAENRGGLTTISGYVNALRSATGSDNVLLLDAGDMWQGSLESNLNEGAAIVQAYNAMGYAAAAIGNHEFDFGPAGPAVIASDTNDDPRGALKLRAQEAAFPFLAANLADTSSGKRVDWQNVRPSTVHRINGVDVGIIGVVTSNALKTTIAANVSGLEVLPLAESIEREAQALRGSGVGVVIVVAHAGGQCRTFTNPDDLSSCHPDSEIFTVARALPSGLVDHIVGGHHHNGIAHVVNGISINSAYSHTHAFSRVDLTIERNSGRVTGRRIFPPQVACPFRDDNDQGCAWSDRAGASPAVYEGYVVKADDAVAAIADRAVRDARDRKLRKVGAYLETPFTLKGNPESALGNLITTAMLSSLPGDIAIHNVSGGIRGILPAGELTYGALYEMFPFDNRAVVLEMTGLDLRKVIAAQIRKSRRRAGIAGIYVNASCSANELQVQMQKANGETIEDNDVVRVIATDFLALGGDGILVPAMPPGGFDYDDTLPLARDILENWFATHKRLHAEDFLSGERPRWQVPAAIPDSCQLPSSP